MGASDHAVTVETYLKQNQVSTSDCTTPYGTTAFANCWSIVTRFHAAKAERKETSTAKGHADKLTGASRTADVRRRPRAPTQPASASAHSSKEFADALKQFADTARSSSADDILSRVPPQARAANS
jgi:hypothetical protein